MASSLNSVTAETLKSEFQFHLPIFGDLYLPNRAEPIHDPLSKVAEQDVYNKLCSMTQS